MNMIVHKGIRYRLEDAKRRGIKPDSDPRDPRARGQPARKTTSAKGKALTTDAAKPTSRRAKNKARNVEDEATGADS